MPIGILPDHPGTTPGINDPTTEDKNLHPLSGTKDPDRHRTLPYREMDGSGPSRRTLFKIDHPIDTDKINKLESK
jgi:hypothetical protein